MSEKLNAIIPTRESSIYPTFGIDVVKPAEWDGDTCVRDMEPVQWVELGSFPETFIVNEARAQALEHGLVLGTTILEDAGDYLTVEVLSR